MEQQPSLLATFLPIVVIIAIGWALALGIKKFANNYPPASQEKNTVSGVGGWLLLLITMLMFLSPFLGAVLTGGNFISTESQYPNLKSLSEWGTFKSWTWWTYVILCCLSFYAGLGLLKERTITAVKRAKIILWIIGPLANLIMGVLLPGLILGIFGVGPQFIGSMVASVIVTTIWTVYLSKSKRVKSTYGTTKMTPKLTMDSSNAMGSIMQSTMQTIAVIAYTILGLFQLAAIMAGLEDWIGLHWLIATPLAFFIAYMPLVGTIVGMFGAVTAWHWPWIQAAGLFFGPFVIIIVIALGAGVLEKFSRRF